VQSEYLAVVSLKKCNLFRKTGHFISMYNKKV